MRRVAKLDGEIGGGSRCGAVFIDVDRERGIEAPEATFVIPDLNGLPEIVRG